MLRYLTVEKEAEAGFVTERSEFISHIARVESREEAEEYIRGIKTRYKDASHNVPAFIIGEKSELKWASDDGEPQGTAGPPILQFLSSLGLTNVVCVVTRYFGGIKLGTGGLVRAYTQGAKMAVEAAGIHEAREIKTLKAAIAYQQLGKLRYAAPSVGCTITETIFAEDVTVTLTFERESEEQVMGLLSDICGGRIRIIEISEKIS